LKNIFKLYKKSPVVHAAIWIFIYFNIATVGCILQKIIRVNNLGKGIALLILSILLFFYVKKNGQFSYYGFQKPNYKNVKKSFFYIPLLLLIILNGITGFNSKLKVIDVMGSVLLAICIGFLEELIFRGFLYKAILANIVVIKSIFISGFVFGLTHILNFFSGESIQELVMQIIIAIGIGIVLTVVFEITSSIIPGIIFHSLFDFVAFVSKYPVLKIDIISSCLVVLISAIYIIYLFRFITCNDTKQIQ
jgi:membrane protease YdiL (CAAX protease family)